MTHTMKANVWFNLVNLLLRDLRVALFLRYALAATDPVIGGCFRWNCRKLD